MSPLLLSIHLVTAIITVGPMTIASSMLPPYARRFLERPDEVMNGAVVRILHRITRVYAVVGILVPIFGVATAASIGVLTNPWLIASIILTALAALLLIAVILPRQARIVSSLALREDGGTEALPSDRDTRRLAMFSGLFALLWVAVVVLMIYRPGSTTGVGM